MNKELNELIFYGTLMSMKNMYFVKVIQKYFNCFAVEEAEDDEFIIYYNDSRTQRFSKHDLATIFSKDKSNGR